MNSASLSSYLLYRLASGKAYLRISPFFARVIRQYAMEYQGLAQVPADKTVLGTLHTQDGCPGPEISIAINQLEFETDSLQQIA